MQPAYKGGRQPGRAKTGGKKKGSINRASLLVREHLDNIGKNPIQELVKLIPKLEVHDQASVWLRLLPYCYTQLKTIEVQADITNNVVATSENVQELCRLARESVVRDTIVEAVQDTYNTIETEAEELERDTFDTNNGEPLADDAVLVVVDGTGSPV